MRAFIADETESVGWIAPDAKEPRDSAGDLGRSLARRRKYIELIGEREGVDIIIEITKRYTVEGTRTQGFVSDSFVYAKKRRGACVEATVTVGDRKFHFAGTSDRGRWSSAADDLAKDIESWTKDNFERIVSLRAK